jgi:serine/threonine protein kinase
MAWFFRPNRRGRRAEAEKVTLGMALLSTLAGRFGWVDWEPHYQKRLGGGTFGTCFAGVLRGYEGAEYRRDPMDVVVKVLDSQRMGEHEGNVKFMREIEVMTLEHPAILSLVAWGVYDCSYCLVTRLMVMDIRKLLKEKRASPTTRSIVALGIAAGMEFLHNNGVIHRDLKPGNVFLSPEGRPVVADFGNARFLTISKMSCLFGTSWYMAPEVFEGPEYDKFVDVYSWAMVFWQLVTNRELFSKKYDREMFALLAVPRLVTMGKRPDASLILDDDKRSLIESCWSGNPNERPSFTKILEHPEILMIEGCDQTEFDAYRREIINER